MVRASLSAGGGESGARSAIASRMMGPSAQRARASRGLPGAVPTAGPRERLDEEQERRGGRRFEREIGGLHPRHTSSRNVARRLVRTALQQFSHVRSPKSWTIVAECNSTSFVVTTPAIISSLLRGWRSRVRASSAPLEGRRENALRPTGFRQPLLRLLTVRGQAVRAVSPVDSVSSDRRESIRDYRPPRRSQT